MYTLTLAGILEDQARYGDLDILGNLTLQGAGAGVTIVDGNQLDRVIDIPLAWAEVDISGVTIRNGSVDFPTGVAESPSWLAENGGCILSCATLTLRNSVVTGCRAGRQGGGIYSDRLLELEDTMVRSNQAGEAGGGVFVANSVFETPTPLPTGGSPLATPTPTATPTAFVFFTPTPTPTPSITPTPTATASSLHVPLERPGVIVADNVSPALLTPTVTPTFPVTPIFPPPVAIGATMRDSVIEDNDAPNGGGVYNMGHLALHNVLLRHNRAVDTTELLCCSDGGGLEPSGGGIYSEGMLTLSDSQVVSNTASAYGGGIANNDLGGYSPGTLILERSTVSGNLSHGRGGGIANGILGSVVDFRQDQVWLINSTVSGNAATEVAAASTPGLASSIG